MLLVLVVLLLLMLLLVLVLLVLVVLLVLLVFDTNEVTPGTAVVKADKPGEVMRGLREVVAARL